MTDTPQPQETRQDKTRQVQCAEAGHVVEIVNKWPKVVFCPHEKREPREPQKVCTCRDDSGASSDCMVHPREPQKDETHSHDTEEFGPVVSYDGDECNFCKSIESRKVFTKTQMLEMANIVAGLESDESLTPKSCETIVAMLRSAAGEPREPHAALIARRAKLAVLLDRLYGLHFRPGHLDEIIEAAALDRSQPIDDGQLDRSQPIGGTRRTGG